MLKLLFNLIKNAIKTLFNPQTIEDFKAEAAKAAEPTTRSKEDIEMELNMMDSKYRIQIFQALEAYKTNTNPNIDELQFLSAAIDVYYEVAINGKGNIENDGVGFWGYAAMGTSLFESILSMPVHWQIGKILAVEEIKADDYMRERNKKTIY